MKLQKILLTALVAAAMVTPAIAEDRLTLSGSMQVRGHMYDYDLESAGRQVTPPVVPEAHDAKEAKLEDEVVKNKNQDEKILLHTTE